jgi:hypothetical protein
MFPIVSYVQINSSITILLLDKSNMVNDVPENDNFACLNPGLSWWCGLWSPHSSPVSLQDCKFLDKVVIFLALIDYEDAFTARVPAVPKY